MIYFWANHSIFLHYHVIHNKTYLFQSGKIFHSKKFLYNTIYKSDSLVWSIRIFLLHTFKRVFPLRCCQLVLSYYLHLLRFSFHHLIFYEYQHYDYYYYCYGLLLSTCRIMTTVICEISYTFPYLPLPHPPTVSLSLFCSHFCCSAHSDFLRKSF